MNKTPFIKGRLAAAGIALAMNTYASAGTATDTFAVTATVANACAVSADDLAFGTYNQLAGVPTDATNTITVNCTLGASYNLGFNTGNGSGATVDTRKMTSGSDTLGYSLYQDALRTTVWGDTDGTDTVAGTGTGLDVPVPIYGRIFADQAATTPAGSYSDTITVTVTY